MLASLRIYTPQNYYITSVSLSMLLKNGKYSFFDFDQKFFVVMLPEDGVLYGKIK